MTKFTFETLYSIGEKYNLMNLFLFMRVELVIILCAVKYVFVVLLTKFNIYNFILVVREIEFEFFLISLTTTKFTPMVSNPNNIFFNSNDLQPNQLVPIV